jgi:acetolactate synthase-1/2/3 large subunit
MSTKVRLADYIAEKLVANDVSHVFMVTGGGAMHLNDAFGRCKGMQYVCCHHEQACAMAAEAYARVSGKIGVVNVTTGPGGINALNGVFGAWTDSIPMLIVSGQVKRETALYKHNLIGKLRQLGDQEVDIVGMVKGITKYAVTVDEPQSIRYHLERGLHLARTGRPGPCWIDVPIDVQATEIEPDSLPMYNPAIDSIRWETADLAQACGRILAKIRTAQRPVLYAGAGVRLSGAYKGFLEVIQLLGIPVVTAWNSNDLLWNDHPLFVGRPGSVGDRAGNFAVQNADVLLILGCRLNIRAVSYGWENFARHAYKIAVDVDAEEMRKPTCKIDLPVHADVAEVIRMLHRELSGKAPKPHAEWIAWCLERRRRYPVVLPEYRLSTTSINPYCFMDELFRQLRDGEIVVTANGTACVTAFQSAIIRPEQRIFHNSGCASMGYDLPAAIGAAYAKPGQRIVCLAGDGSLMMNLQELQTVIGQRLPVKVFVLNNGGYHSIRQTQRAFFEGRLVGCGPESGVAFPDFGKLAAAFGVTYRNCANQSQLEESVRETLSADGPALCEVMLDKEQPFAPRASSRCLPDGRLVTAPLEDMAPFLSRSELADNMLVTREHSI